MASHMHLTSPSESESKQPYKVAGLRFNPKFISSISKGLSRGPERVSERLTRTTLPSPTPPRCFSSCLARSSPPPPLPPLLWKRRNARRCTGASASTPLHYDSYIAIFIISAAHRCPRSRLTSIVFFFLLVFFPFFSLPPVVLSRAEKASSFLANHCRWIQGPSARTSRRRRRVAPRHAEIAQWRTHSRRSLQVSAPS